MGDQRRADSLLPENGHPYGLASRADPVPRQPAASATPVAERLDSIVESRRRKQPPQELFVCRSPKAHDAPISGVLVPMPRTYVEVSRTSSVDNIERIVGTPSRLPRHKIDCLAGVYNTRRPARPRLPGANS